MKKLLLVVCAVCCSVFAVSAQQTTDQVSKTKQSLKSIDWTPKYKGEINVGYAIAGEKFKFDEIKNYYKTVNIYKFSKHFSQTHYVPFLNAYTKALGDNEYYEQVLRVITMLDEPVIKAKRLSGQLWYEIDDIQDLDIATSMFTPDEDEKVDLLQARFGGYWRYPQLVDFCYLVNPYFPPQKLVDEIKASFDTIDAIAIKTKYKLNHL